MSKGISLLENPIRVATPFIKVTIGDYTFGVFNQNNSITKNSDGSYRITSQFKYPNYIQSLQIVKINGQVNQYTLVLKYPITENNDPNFFEKVFSSVSKTRKIIFSYGDLSAPKFLYKNEEAIILDIKNNFDINSAVIQYNISAVSTCKLATASAFNFTGPEFTGIKKPSDIIKKLLRQNSKYGLLDVFSGMRNMDLVESMGLIRSDDCFVTLQNQQNINILDYLRYLVSNMRRSTSLSDKSLYKLVVVDDTSDIFGGPYFKVINTNESSDSLDTYQLDIGYPSTNVVTSFTIDNNESYSLLYEYSKKLNTNEYVSRIDDNGNISTIYSPNITSNNDIQLTNSNDLNWWKNVTQYPISATVTLKGLLRPAILMSKVRLSVLFYGKAHISSGEYIINKQVDTIDGNGCWTTLNLVRIDGDGTRNFKNNV